MSKTWTIWAILFVAAGMAGLSLIVWSLYEEDKNLRPYRNQFNHDDNEYLKIFEEWNRLSPEEKLDNPWGQGKYVGSKTQEEIRNEQPARLKADLVDLATGVKEPHVLADLLYGNGWQEKVGQYRRTKEIRDAVAMVSIVSIFAGTLVLLANTAKWIVSKLNPAASSTISHAAGGACPSPPTANPMSQPGTEKRTDPLEPSSPGKSVSHRRCSDGPGMFDSSKWAPLSKMDSVDFDEPVESPPAQSVVQPISHNLFSEIESAAPIGTLMSTAPVVSNLAELTQEVSAIRKFAAQQQDRVRQLQEGYDWNIIKRFCLRVIHCIDNLDNRIHHLAETSSDVGILQDVRDELVFALESSGVEQFEPALDSDYTGLEKRVEAVKGRIHASNSKLKGHIAEIVRPGYEYRLSDEEVKVVRCAQVKLYG